MSLFASLTTAVSGLNAQSSAIGNISDDIANAQTTVTNAQSVNSQTQNTLTDMLQKVEGVSSDQIGAQILQLQNSLQASLSTTARLSSLTLVTYLGATTG